MSTPEAPMPHGHPADHPAEPPAWGRQPPGGWGGGPSARPDDPAETDHGWDPYVLPRSNRAEPGRTGSGRTGAAADRQSEEPEPVRGAADPYADDLRYGADPYSADRYGADPYGADPYGGAAAGYSGRGEQDGGRVWGPPPFGDPPHGDAPYPDQRYPERPLWGPADPEYGGGEGQPPWLPHPPRRSAVPFLAAGAVALVLGVVAVLGFVAPGFFVSRVFDAPSVQAAVARALVDDYGLASVDGVVCADAVPVREGTTFDCAATVAGEPATVPIRVTSDSGDYEVGAPAF